MNSTRKTARIDPLIEHIMVHRGCDQNEAEAWADTYCGDWRNTPVPKAKRIKSIASDEKEWD